MNAYYFSQQCKKMLTLIILANNVKKYLFEPPVLTTRGKTRVKKLIVEQLVPSNVGIQENNALTNFCLHA